MKKQLEKMTENVARTDDLLVFVRAIRELESAIPRMRDEEDREILLYHARGVTDIVLPKFEFLSHRLESVRGEIALTKLKR